MMISSGGCTNHENKEKTRVELSDIPISASFSRVQDAIIQANNNKNATIFVVIFLIRPADVLLICRDISRF
jgi:hypothetical protein